MPLFGLMFTEIYRTPGDIVGLPYLTSVFQACDHQGACFAPSWQESLSSHSLSTSSVVQWPGPPDPLLLTLITKACSSLVFLGDGAVTRVLNCDPVQDMHFW